MKIGEIKVIDANRPLKIEITENDVKRGDNKNPDACAAARAIVHEIDGVVAAKVHIARTYVKVRDKKTRKTKWIRYYTPSRLRDEIIAFDRGGTFEPGEYRLATVQPTARFGVERKRYDTSKGKRHGKPSTRTKPSQVTNIRGTMPHDS